MSLPRLSIRAFALSLGFAPFVVGSLACGVELYDEEAGTEGSEELEIPAAVQAAFDRSCATDACHSAATRAGDLSLAAADSISILTATAGASPMPGTRLVVMGDIEASYLALKMMSPDLPMGTSIVGLPMPPASTDESDADVEVVLAWIRGELDEGDTATSASETEDDVTDSSSGGESDSADSQDDACFGPEVGQGATDPLSLATDIVPIFAERCLGDGCHAGANENKPYLDADRVRDQIIDVRAASANMDIVEPDKPDESYLWHKVNGSQHLADGGGGLIMPFDGRKLCASELQAIYSWIFSGAQP